MFLTRLNEFTGTATSPIVEGVQHRVIPSGSEDGLAITLVPESVVGPHMAKLGEDRYFKRSGASFYRMEHFDLEDMFGRRARPNLTVRLELRPRPDPDQHEDLHFVVANHGRGLAKYPGFICTLDQNVSILAVSGSIKNATGLNQGNPVVSYQNNLEVIHPTGHEYHVGQATILRARKGDPLSAKVIWYCENMQPRSDSIVVSSNA